MHPIHFSENSTRVDDDEAPTMQGIVLAQSVTNVKPFRNSSKSVLNSNLSFLLESGPQIIVLLVVLVPFDKNNP